MVRLSGRRLILLALVVVFISVAGDATLWRTDRAALADDKEKHGAAPPPGSGSIRLSSYVRVVDGQSIDAVINGKRVAIVIQGIDVPRGNTACGKQSANTLRAIARIARQRGGIVLVEDPGEVFDSRGRRVYYLEDTAGRPLVADLVKSGVARPNGKGKDRDQLRQQDDDARTNRRGCLWNGGRRGEIEWTAPDVAVDAPDEEAQVEPTAWQADEDDPEMGLIKAALSASIQLPVSAVPNGFQDEVVVNGMSEPTALAFTPDGRVLVATKRGVVHVVKNGSLLATPFIDIQSRVNDYWDRGLLGIAVDPNFASNGYVYLAYTYENDENEYTGPKTSRVARYTASGDTASVGSELVLLGKQVGRTCYDFPAGADCIPADFFSHSVGALKFAPDGTLFFASGEGANFNVVHVDALRSQDLDSLGGKLIRITPTGDGVSSNPFWNGQATANRSKVWAYGLRNPFRFNLRPGTSIPYLGDVGWGVWEEINVATAGANFGWPCYEGPDRTGGYWDYQTCITLYSQGASAVKMPLVNWDHNAGSAAAVGGTFYTGTAFPSQYQGAFFFADYSMGFIRTVTVDANHTLTGGPSQFGTGTNPVAIEMAPDGTLYYISIFSGEVRRIRYGSSTPPPPPPGTGTHFLSDLTWISAVNGWGPVEKDKSNGEELAGDGLTITLNGTTYTKGLGVHAASDVRYNLGGACNQFASDVGVDDETGGNGSVVFEVWLDGAKVWDSGTMTGATATKQVGGSATGVSVAGKQELRLVVTTAGDNDWWDHADWANAKVTCGSTNTPPVATISSPSSTLKYRVGDTISFAGSATDAQDGTLAPARLEWDVRVHHCPGGACHLHPLLEQSGVASGSFVAPDEADDNKIEIILTATDSGGLTGTTSVILLPQTVQITLASNPSGLQVVYSGTTGTTPMTQTAVVGSQRTLQAPSPQGSNTFTSWSDGGAQTHNITIGTTNATYTATYSTPPPSSGTTYLSDMTWTSATNGWGPVEKDRSNGEELAGDGLPIKLNGVTYAKGLGVHAASDITYTLPANCTRFMAQVGVDDETGADGTVVFQVWLNEVKAWDSGTMTGSSATKSVGSATGLDITGKQQLRLVVTTAGDNDWFDHADWADAKVTCGSTPPPTTRYLSDMTWTSATNGLGPVEKDKSNGDAAAGDGVPIKLNGTPYTKGLGTHAASDIRYNLGGTCTTFSAAVGVDDEVGTAGSVVFQVWLDGVKAWDSGKMTGSTATKLVGGAAGLSVAGKQELRLVVTVSTNGSTSDHADWADAKVTCN